MGSSYDMNITFQVWNQPKYSILLQEDFTLTDFIKAVNKIGLSVKDYIFIIRGKKLNLEDEVEFATQRRLFTGTFIHVTPKKTDMSTTALTQQNRCVKLNCHDQIVTVIKQL